MGRDLPDLLKSVFRDQPKECIVTCELLMDCSYPCRLRGTAIFLETSMISEHGCAGANTTWYNHITPVFDDRHWLPVVYRLIFKIAIMIWNCVHGVASTYLSDLCVYPPQPSPVISICAVQLVTILVLRETTAAAKQRFRCRQRADYVVQPALHTWSVAERRQLSSEDRPVLNYSAYHSSD